MPYCPKCRYEYREGIEECPDCDVELVEVLPTEQEQEKADLRDIAHNTVPLENEIEQIHFKKLLNLCMLHLC